MKMRTNIAMVAVLAVALLGCRDRAAEKKIAELESRLAQLEGNKSPATAASPAITNPTAAPEEKTCRATSPSFSLKPQITILVRLVEGQKVSYTYSVRNVGEAPLIIQNAQPSCGCTVPDWTKTPIPPGRTGFVKAEFDTHGKTGIQNKTITVTSNSWPKTAADKI